MSLWHLYDLNILSVYSILQLFKNTDEEINIASYPQGFLCFFKFIQTHHNSV